MQMQHTFGCRAVDVTAGTPAHNIGIMSEVKRQNVAVRRAQPWIHGVCKRRPPPHWPGQGMSGAAEGGRGGRGPPREAEEGEEGQRKEARGKPPRAKGHSDVTEVTSQCRTRHRDVTKVTSR